MAIAYDSSARANTASTDTLTWAHTCTGTDLVLVVFVEKVNDTPTGATYNGVAMTQVSTEGSNPSRTTYRLVNPATGANNVIVSFNNANQAKGCSASYTGVNQINPIDSSASNDDNDGSPVALNFTTVGTNCWLVAGVFNPTESLTITAGSGTTVRITNSANKIHLVDSGASVPAGSNSLNFTYTGTTDNFHIRGVSIAEKKSFSPKTIII